MNIDKKIKELRVKNELTQEELANMLGVSMQAVSRWETGITFPDITLLPILANIFAVTTDELLGRDVLKQEDEIKDILKEDDLYSHLGEPEKREILLKEALRKYPHNYQLKSRLINALFVQSLEDTEDGEKHQEELIDLANNILNKCYIDEYRYNAMQLLVFVYHWQHKDDKALEIIDKLPDMYVSKEIMMEDVLKGNELKEHITNNIFANIGELYRWTFSHLAKTCPFEEEIKVNLKYVEFLNFIHEDKDFGFDNQQLADTYKDCAKAYAKVQNKEETLKYLQLAKEYAIAYDSIKEPFEYTSLLIKGAIYEPNKVIRSGNIDGDTTYLAALINETNEKVFDFIRNDEEFKELIKK